MLCQHLQDYGLLLDLKRLSFAALLLLLTPAAWAVGVRSDVRSAAGCSVTAIVAEPVCPDAPCGHEITVAYHGQPVVMDLPSAQEWTLRATTSDCWSETVAVNSDKPASIRIWRKGAIEGHLALDGKEMQVRLRSSSGASPPDNNLDATAPCPVKRDHSFQCGVPAGVPLDLKISTQGTAPLYFFDVSVDAGRAAALGTLRPVAGGSLAGSVVDAKGRGLAEVTVELAPVTPMTERKDRDTFRSYSAKTSARGFFQIAGIASGVYHLTSRKAGYATADAGLVEIRASDNREVNRTLTQPELQSLEIVITPPADPAGKPWSISLTARRPFVDRFEGRPRKPVPLSGIAQLTGLNTGQYLLDVADSAGNVRRTQMLELHEGLRSISIAIDDIVIRGRVTAGSDALLAHVTFWDSMGVRIGADADDTGAYNLSVPHDGKWYVEVKPTAIKYFTLFRVKTVEVRRPEGASHATVDIELPGGRLAADVVAANGAPSDGIVRVYHDGTPIAQAFAAAGHVDIFGIAEGAAQVDAQNPTSRSEFVSVDVTDSSTVRLVLQPKRRLQGSVVTMDNAPVAGAILRAASANVHGDGEAVSGPNGRFDMKIANGGGPIDLVVIAPGFSIRMITIPAGYDLTEPVSVVVAPTGGRLRIRIPGAPPWPVIRRGGAPLGLTMLFYPPGADGYPGGMTPNGFIAEMEPGPYTVCRSEALDRCRTVTVREGSEAMVDFVSEEARP